MSDGPMRGEQFSLLYRSKMIIAYPVIAGMTREEFYTSDRAAKDAAFERILQARNLEPTHREYLARNDARHLFCDHRNGYCEVPPEERINRG